MPTFNFSEVGKQTDVTYDSFGSPACVLTVDNEQFVRTMAEYTYTADRKQESCKTTTEYFASDDMTDEELVSRSVAVQTFAYNASGDPVRIESYVEGEEQTSGREVEEHEYDANGYEVRTRTYNTLDPSSCLCTEVKLDENGRTTAEADATGEWETTFSYTPDGAVRSKRLPNGSRLAYGFDRDGSVTAITHSTKNGEENSTNQAYTLDVVTEVKSGNNRVQYAYDSKRRVTSVSLNGVENYVTYAYSGEDTDAETVTATMNNGTVETITRNAYGNVTQSTRGDRSVTNTYDVEQKLTQTVDSISGTTTLAYTAKRNLASVTAPGLTESYSYDETGNTLESKTITGNGIHQTYAYSYKPTADKALDCMTIDGTVVSPKTDALGRNTGKTIEIGQNKIAEEQISYVKFGDHATNLLSTVRYAVNGAFLGSIQYQYDSMGNIIEVDKNGRCACRYEYDTLGRLTREDNVAFGKTKTWAYDNNGNILACYEYEITAKPTSELHLQNGTCKLYTYADNSDRLLSYDGEAFEYDILGNPTTYRGKNATWAYGRQLVGFDGHTFTYDARGRRTAKDTLTFFYDDSGKLIAQSNGLEFLYDHTGVFAVKYNGDTYYYRKDAQKNIVALFDNTGTTVVKYKYDAWGKCNIDESTTNVTLANLNPFRYRSYYYDTETELYFLQTRYYDPETGRFMTIDDISYLDPDSINGLNLYAYCLNNPVMMIDGSGCEPEWWQWVLSGLSLAGGIALCFVPGAQVAGVGLIVSGATSMASNIMSAAGVDGKTACIVTNVLSVVGGIFLCMTPFASIGASMIGSGVLGIAGGYAIQELGGSFELGSAIGNMVGGFLGGQIYKGLVNHGIVPFKTSIKNVVENPLDDINNPNIGPKQGSVTDKIRQIQQTGRYEVIDVIKIPNGTYQAQDGHHTLRALISLGYKYIWVQFTK